MFKEFAPGKVFSAGLALALLLFFAALYISTHLPWLGFQVQPDENGVRVASVSGAGPVSGHLLPGDLLLSIGAGDRIFLLKAADAMVEPDDVVAFSDYNRFFARHAELWPLLLQPELTLEVSRGAGESVTSFLVTFQPGSSRPLDDLPWLFWYQIACGLAIALMGTAAWAFVQTELGPRYYALAGWGLALCILASAIYTTRELSLPSELFLNLSRLNQFGAMLCGAAGTALLYFYPTRLARWRFDLLALIALVVILALNWGQLRFNLDILARWTLLGWLLLDIALACIQWRRTRTEPVERARLKWFIYAWFIGISCYLGLVIIPQVLGSESLVHQTHGWFFLVLTYLGIALGVVRYRLFDLDRWVWLAWFWFAFGVLFIVFDAMLVMVLKIETTVGLLIALAVAGWVYLPLRQGVLLRFMSLSEREQHEQLPDLLQQAFLHHGTLDEQWSQAMRVAFKPLALDIEPQPQEVPLITDNGLRLRVPSLDRQQSLVLGYALGGQRLFTREDVRFCEQVSMLFVLAQNYHQSYANGVKSERSRVARDLHDDVGARLLSLVYRSRQDDELQQLARDTLQELREVIQGLQKEAAPLSQSFSRWQAEARERCRLFNVRLNISMDERLQSVRLSSRMERNLSRVLREALSNIFQHARATEVWIRLLLEEQRLHLSIEDDGKGFSSSGSHGLGLHGIRQRCEELGGEMSWWNRLDGGAALRCEVPLYEER